jgi:hypothetical protein
MRLVDVSGNGHYINMDYITSVYKKNNDFCIEILYNRNDTYFVITEEAYNTILIYGKAKI